MKEGVGVVVVPMVVNLGEIFVIGVVYTKTNRCFVAVLDMQQIMQIVQRKAKLTVVRLEDINVF